MSNLQARKAKCMRVAAFILVGSAIAYMVSCGGYPNQLRTVSLIEAFSYGVTNYGWNYYSDGVNYKLLKMGR